MYRRLTLLVAALLIVSLSGTLDGNAPLTLGGLWLMRQQGEAYSSLARLSPALFAALLLMVPLGMNAPAPLMTRFWQMLAHYHGQTWNAAEPA